MYELSAITLCRPAPFGSPSKRIVNTFELVLIAVTSYSLKSSTGVSCPESEKKEIKSPTLNALPDASTSSIVTDVSPIAPAPLIK